MKYDSRPPTLTRAQIVFTPLVVGAIVAFAALAFVFSLWSWQSARFFNGQRVIQVSPASIAPTPYASVLLSHSPSVPLTVTLPNNLLEYVGGLYEISCATPQGHQIKILPGTMATTWDGAHSTATCVPGESNAGFLFRVLSPSAVRIVAAQNVVFSV